MKKLLLLAAAGLMAASASADYSEYFTVSFKGAPVANGATITINKDDAELDSKGLLTFEVVIGFDATEYPYFEEEYEYDYALIAGGLFYNTPASKDESKTDVSFCSGINCYPSTDNDKNIGYKEGYEIVDGDPAPYWNIHVRGVDPNVAFNQTYRLEMCAQEPVESVSGPMQYDNIAGTDFVCYLNVTNSDSSVEGIDVENAAPEYYDLQGVRVANPDKGIYIVKRGSKVTKELKN